MLSRSPVETRIEESETQKGQREKTGQPFLFFLKHGAVNESVEDYQQEVGLMSKRLKTEERSGRLVWKDSE